LLPTGKLFVALLLGVALMFGGWGCSPDNNNESLSLTDHAGRKVTINGEPQRIISLVPSHTEILYALGVGDKLVGVDDYSDYPVAALDVDKVGNPM
jgi:iron complex transport system substrate-binding protein